MALETFSVSIEAEINKFITSINTALSALNGISERAQKVSANVGESFSNKKIGEGADASPLINLFNLLSGNAQSASAVINSAFNTVLKNIQQLGSIQFSPNFVGPLQEGAAAGTQVSNVIGNLLPIATAAAEAALIVLGGVVSSVGDQLLELSKSSAEGSASTSLQFHILEAEIKNTEAVLNESQGSVESWKEELIKLSAQTGFTQVELAQTAAKFIGLNKELGLSKEQISGLIETTAVLGLRVHSLDRATRDTLDTFEGQSRGFRTLTGANINVAKITELTTEAIERQGIKLSSLNDATLNIIRNTAIYDAVQRAAKGSVDAITSAHDNLEIANRRLAGAFNEFNNILGNKSQAIFASISNALATIVTDINNTFPALISAGGIFLGFSGVLLKIIGTLITFSATLALVVTGITFLNLALSGGIPSLVGLSGGLSTLLSRLAGVSLQVTSTGSLFRAFGSIISAAFASVIGQVSTFISGMTGISVASLSLRTILSSIFTGFIAELSTLGTILSGTFTGVLTLSQGFSALGGTITGAVGGFILIASKFILLGTAISSIIEGIRIFTLEYLALTANQDGFVASVLKAISITGLLTTAFTVLSNTVTIVSNVFSVGFGFVLLGIISSIRVLTFSLTGLVGILALIPGLGSVFKPIEERVKALDAAVGQAAEDVLLTTTVVTQHAIESTSVILGFSKAAVDAGNAVSLAGRKIAEGLDPAVTEGIAKSVVKIFEAQLNGVKVLSTEIESKLQEEAKLRTQLVTRSITDETNRSAAILKIEQDLTLQTIAAEEQKLGKSLEIIKFRQEFELENLGSLLGKQSQHADKRIELQQKIVGASSKAEQSILQDVISKLETQLTAVHKQQDDRVAVIQGAIQRIRDIEEGLNTDLKAIKLKTLDEDERQVALRKDIAERIAAANKLAADGNFDLAKKEFERVKGLIPQLINDPTIAKALQEVSNSAFNGIEHNVGLIGDALQRSLGTDLPASVKQATERLLTDLSRTGNSLEGINKNSGDLNETLRRIGEITSLREQAGFLQQVADGEKSLNQGIINVGEEGLKRADQIASILETKLATLGQRLQESLKNVGNEIEVIGKLNNEQILESINDIRKRAKLEPIEFTLGVTENAIDDLQKSIDAAIPIDARKIPVGLKVTDAQKDSFKEEIKAIALQKEVLTKLIPNTDDLDRKIKELQAKNTEVPTSLKVDTGSVGEGAAVSIKTLSKEITNNIGIIPISATVVAHVDTKSLDKVKSDLSGTAVNIPLAVPTIDIPGGSIHALNEAASVITDVIGPKEPINISSAMVDGINIPGVGTASFAEAPNAIRNSVTPEDPIAVLSKFDNTILIPGIGPVPIEQAKSALLVPLTPNAPISVPVEVNQSSLDAAVAKVEQSFKEATANSFDNAARDARNTSALNNALNAINNAEIINRFAEQIKGLGKETDIELSSILKKFNIGVQDASSTVTALIDLQKNAQLKSLEEIKKAREDALSHPLTTSARVVIHDADITGGSIHALNEAASVITRIITPSPVNATLNVDTNPLISKIDGAVGQTRGVIRDLVTGLNTSFSGLRPINLQTNVNQVIDQLNFLAKQQITIPVNLKATKIDIKGGSIHELTEAAETFKKILTPDAINIGLKTLTAPILTPIINNNNIINSQQLGQTGTNPTTSSTRRVVVDINMPRNKFSIETDDKGADQLESFADELQKTNSSSGVYISPFSRSWNG